MNTQSDRETSVGITRTGRQLSLIPPQADSIIGHSAGLLARLFLLRFIRKHAVGDSLVRRHSTYRDPLPFERHEPAMVHGRFAVEMDDTPALLVDVE